jgi:hypothetical protein
MVLAEAIRDLQTVRALDFLTPGEKEELQARTGHYLRKTAPSNFADVDAFETENYRRLNPSKKTAIFDGVREMLRTYLPKQISWSKEEKASRKELYEEGIYKPEVLSPTADRIANLSSAWAVRCLFWCRCTQWHCARVSRKIWSPPRSQWYCLHWSVRFLSGWRPTKPFRLQWDMRLC